jgi:hypothetical protein
MRLFAVLVLIISGSLHANPQVPENAGIQAKGSPNHKNQASSETQQRRTDPAPDSVDSSQARKSTPDQDKQNGQRDSDDRAYRVNIESQPTSGWTIAYVFITAVLGLLGGGTLWVLIYQTATLRKQIRLQERGLRQWVNTSDWKASLTDDVTSEGGRFVSVSCGISNITRAPITLVLISLASEDRPGIRADEGFPANTLLLPDNPLRHNVWIPLTAAQHDAYTEIGCLLEISGVVLYIDALEDTWKQGFRLTLAVSPTSAITGGYTHTLSKVRRVGILDSPEPFWRRAVHWWIAQVEAMKNGESEND